MTEEQWALWQTHERPQLNVYWKQKDQSCLGWRILEESMDLCGQSSLSIRGYCRIIFQKCKVDWSCTFLTLTSRQLCQAKNISRDLFLLERENRRAFCHRVRCTNSGGGVVIKQIVAKLFATQSLDFSALIYTTTRENISQKPRNCT